MGVAVRGGTMFWKKKRRKSNLDWVDFFNANDPKYLERNLKTKERLIEYEKSCKPDDCLCCIFFKWVFGEDHKVCGGQCAAKTEIAKELFLDGGIADGCPLMEEEDGCICNKGRRMSDAESMGNGLLTAEEIQKAMKKLTDAEKTRTGYTYLFPSPNEGKRLMIHGWIGPGQAADMVWKVYCGESKIEDYESMEEID